MPGESAWLLLLGGLLCLVGGLGGFLSERRRLQAVINDLEYRLKEADRRVTELDSHLTELQGDNSSLSSFLVVLPDVVRRLNSNMSKRSIPPLLVSTLDQLFEPSQILVYTKKDREELVLAHGKGLPEGVVAGHSVRFGQGRVGLVARHQMAMVKEDLHSDSMFRREAADQSDPPWLLPEMIAPMVHEGETLGVICVGGVGRCQRDEKRMIKLVADLGSLALHNVELFNQLENMANRDSLTNLASKRYLNLRLGDLTHRAEQTHLPLSVIIFDIDHFKKFNDTYGHLAGDEILKMFASILKGQLRGDDIPARYGGEEFVVVLPNTTKEDALRIADKIRGAIETHPFQTSSGSADKQVQITVSGGVASLKLDGSSTRELISAADQALYLAKEQGRNRVVGFKSRYLSDDEAVLGASA